MTELRAIERLFSLTARKRFSRPREFATSQLAFTHYGDEDVYLGRAIFSEVNLGMTKFGDYILLSGVYQRKYIRGKTRFYRQRYSITRNPRTARQQAWRGAMREAVAAWHALTKDEQDRYNELGKYRGRAGYNLFLSRYLKSK